MASFSVGEAVGSGFRVLARRPLNVIIWGLAYLAIFILPMALLVMLAIPGLVAIGQAGDDADPAAVMSIMGPLMAFYPVLFLASITAQAVLMGAAYRSVLEPEASRFAYLRLSGQELWLALVSIVLSFLLGIGAFVIFLPVGIVAGLAGAGAAQGSGETAAALVAVPIVLIGIGVFVWLALRFSLAYPMSFADRTFRLFESWTLTRGNTLRLLGMYLLVILIVVALEAVLIVVGGVAVFAALGGSFQALESGNLGSAGPALAAAALFCLLLFTGFVGLVSLIAYAPAADAYRQLRPSPEAAAFA